MTGEHVRQWRVGDRVRRSTPTTAASDGTTHAASGIVEGTHYARARPTVDVYWGTRAGGHAGDSPVRVVTTEAPEALVFADGVVLQPAEVARRQAAESGVPYREEPE